ncbi:MAG: pantoate kinase [Methanomassiliicoccales archaeon]|jgi:pantoate kinase|nr:pantoate kinase [Methanomassiliicoccales archaeon]
MKATAFCPGHITGFFQICEHEEILRTGSRGAGLCISLGALSTVKMKRGSGRIEIRINGQKNDAPVTRQALAKLIFDREFDVLVETTLDLPVGQGFGMSAAGTLAASLAVASLMDLPFQKALEVAHEAEIVHRTGLGDVSALSRGGATFRRVEGLPPYGIVDRVAGDAEIVLGVVGPPIPTARVLHDFEMRERINVIGKECVERFSRSPTLSNLFRISREFASRSGIMSECVRNALDAIDGLGPASMVMLGNSIFAAGEAEEIEKQLGKFGETYRVRIDWIGPRVIADD